MTATNNVQTLHENTRGRGRPQSPFLVCAAKCWGGQVQSRSALYGRIRVVGIATVAVDLGLLNADYRDVATNARMMTKLSELGRIFPDAFWDTDEGRSWIMDSWRNLVEMSIQELIEEVRERNPKARVAA